MAKRSEPAVVLPVSKFSKQQILQSKRYRQRRDLLAALLKDEEQYSHAGVTALIEDFLKGKVK